MDAMISSDAIEEAAAEQSFRVACDRVQARGTNGLSEASMLLLYGLFKVATQRGTPPPATPPPAARAGGWLGSAVSTFKHDAWVEQQRQTGGSPLVAKRAYVAAVERLFAS